MKQFPAVIFKGKYPTPRDGQEAEVTALMAVGDTVAVDIRFPDGYEMGVHAEEVFSD